MWMLASLSRLMPCDLTFMAVSGHDKTVSFTFLSRFVCCAGFCIIYPFKIEYFWNRACNPKLFFLFWKQIWHRVSDLSSFLFPPPHCASVDKANHVVLHRHTCQGNPTRSERSNMSIVNWREVKMLTSQSWVRISKLFWDMSACVVLPHSQKVVGSIQNLWLSCVGFTTSE